MNKIVLAAAASVLALASVPAFAQDQSAATGVHAYGNLGYSHLDPSGADLNSLGARLGARYNYFGVEGEGFFGIGSHDSTVSGLPASTKMSHEFAGYAVGFLPVTPRFDVLARIGYGNTRFSSTVGSLAGTKNVDSVNYGAGAQYFLTANDGIRADYTRNDYRDGFGHANVWGVSYVRKF